MELNRIPTLVVGLIVAILIVTVVAIPIIEDSAKMIASDENNPSAQYNMVAGESLVLSGSGGSYTANGTALPSYSGYYLILSDNITIMEGVSQTIIHDISNNKVTSTTSEIVFTANDGRWSYTYNDTEYGGDYTFMFYPDPAGSYGYYRQVPVYMTEGNTGYIISQPAGSDPNYRPGFVAEFKDKAVTSIMSTPYILGSGNTVTTVDLDISDITLDTYDDYDLELSSYYGPNTRVTYEGFTEKTNNIMAPISYKVITSDDSAIITIIQTIPILLIVSLLVSIVGVALARNQ